LKQNVAYAQNFEQAGIFHAVKTTKKFSKQADMRYDLSLGKQSGDQLRQLFRLVIRGRLDKNTPETLACQYVGFWPRRFKQE